MNLKATNTDFTLYTFEDFLQNDFFISSMKHPTEETINFWKQFELSAPSNINEFTAAKEYLAALSVSEDTLSDNEMTGLWARIDTTNAHTAGSKRRKLRYIGWSAAASILLILGSFLLIENYGKHGTPDITNFAMQTKIDLPETTETLLILSEEKTVSINKKESEITYNKQDIKADEESIVKEKTATYNQLVIPRGKRSVLTFSDGSKVWINSGTRVIYPAEFEDKKREIYVDGEIYIEVAKDENRPFYVRTKEMNVRVLGTKFNVTAYEADSAYSVVLVEGSVQVESEHSPKTILSPNQMFSMVNGSVETDYVDVDQYTSWIYGLYRFKSAPLSHVLNRLSIYYGINIESEPSFSQIKCSGKIDLKDDFEVVLNGLTFVAPIKYTYDEQKATYQIVKNSE
ncbi:FecR family protein [Bacteroides sp. 224]|uniref:FecR family protein n=1 Tax=Bacteroides sp. 224 TaxID=2302936 RepID=UPI0013D536EA|nr:FecR domain-containing protein [Bacteroides sp. 224]NDV63716.1 FecR family protein [Bacteroides sp. 224]